MPEHLPVLEEKELAPPPEERLLSSGERSAAETSERAEGRQRQDREDSARRYVEQHAVSGEKTSVEPEKLESKTEPEQHIINQELRNHAYQNLLRRTRRQLGPADRTLSQVVHQPLVERLSDVVSATVARPSGVLGGSALAFVGTCGLLLVSKRYGFSYNFLAFALFFAAGFILGLIGELIIRLLRRRA